MIEVSFLIHPRLEASSLSELSCNLTRTRGVTAVQIGPAASQVTIGFDSRLIDTHGLAAAVHDAGYEVTTTSASLTVTGMTCASCAFHVESALTDIPGVIEAEVDLQSGTAAVTVVPDGVDWQMVRHALAKDGYQAGILTPSN